MLRKEVPYLKLIYISIILLSLVLIFPFQVIAHDTNVFLKGGSFFSSQATLDESYLYLYFPTASDTGFPEWGTPYGIDTSPAAIFDVADLDSGIGTTTQLRQRVFEMITDDYIEFNVSVSMSTSDPSPTDNRWQVVAIGSDSEIYGGNLYGAAQAVDIGDADSQDYARVYAESFLNEFGGAGGALAGTSSTLERWATAIAETTSHEAAHNYGAGHDDSAPVPASVEDDTNNHIMATGSTGLTGEQRASFDRHFSDTTYSLLGYNLGLNIDTLLNWDFINPNDKDAHTLQMKILSEAASLTIGLFYDGIYSPWVDPIIKRLGTTTETFQGNIYNVFELEFNTDRNWLNGADGVAPPGVYFHTGASFIESDAILVRETILLDSGGNELPLSPRIYGFDPSATLDLTTGDFSLTIFNSEVADKPFILRDFDIQLLPRMADINTMVAGAELTDRFGIPIVTNTTKGITQDVEITDKYSIKIANLLDERFVDFIYVDCEKTDSEKGEFPYCPEGSAISLFPSTYVYVIATIVDPNATYWDLNEAKFVTGELESQIFYQFSGFIPDFNDNGLDDLLDIREGRSADENENGVPDEAEPSTAPIPLFETLSSIVLVSILVLINRRKK
ncbi:MAG: hypothetical protein HeimC3_53110 [Candidatus Heimdallarchaeota archaeon LC_3]|nr:MAG: hypothetical protein HeimC3_53110 [Candidatus Heimdallarchaeota archaeon LC_3]